VRKIELPAPPACIAFGDKVESWIHSTILEGRSLLQFHGLPGHKIEEPAATCPHPGGP
jgi:hypothetical protein